MRIFTLIFRLVQGERSVLLKKKEKIEKKGNIKIRNCIVYIMTRLIRRESDKFILPIIQLCSGLFVSSNPRAFVQDGGIICKLSGRFQFGERRYDRWDSGISLHERFGARTTSRKRFPVIRKKYNNRAQ